MDNKYIRGAVLVVGGVVLLGVLLWLGEFIANASSDDAFGLTAQGALGVGGWLTWLIIGGVWCVWRFYQRSLSIFRCSRIHFLFLR